MIAAGSAVVGYILYHLVRMLVTFPGIPLFFRISILVGGAGVIIVILGLIRERIKKRKEEHDADYND
ncbi:hypothetical protein LM597_05145 [Candidatus Acetothermia bacterium]|nr:hypothetical protein [Candidatus Acetothermia bacterium]